MIRNIEYIVDDSDSADIISLTRELLISCH